MVYKMKIKYSWLLILLNSFLFSNVSAQQTPYLIDKSYNGLDLPAFINKAEQNLNVHFFYQKDSLPAGLQMVIENDSTPLEQSLMLNLKPYQLFATVDQAGNVFITKGVKIKTALPPAFFNTQQTQDFDSDSLEDAKKY